MADDDKKDEQELSEDEKLAAEWEAAMEESGDEGEREDEWAAAMAEAGETGQAEEQPGRFARRTCRERDDPVAEPLPTYEIVLQVMYAARRNVADPEKREKIRDQEDVRRDHGRCERWMDALRFVGSPERAEEIAQKQKDASESEE